MIDREQQTKMIKKNNSRFECDIFDLDKNIIDSKPSVYYFPGNLGITLNSAISGCSFIENGISILFPNKNVLDNVSIYGLFYGKDFYNSEIGCMSNEEIDLFVKNHLLSRCMDEKGNFLNEKNILLNMSKVTFVCLCHGTTELNKIILSFRQKLLENGFTKNSVNRVVNNLFSVSYAPESKLSLCPNVQAMSLSDSHNAGEVSQLFEKNYGQIFDEPTNGIVVDYDSKGMFLGEKLDDSMHSADSIKILSTKLLNDHENFDEHHFKILSRDENWNLKLYSDKNLDCFSQMFYYAVSANVNHGIMAQKTNDIHPLDLKELYKNIQKIEISQFSQEELKNHTK